MRILFTTNAPSPYRVGFFNELGKTCGVTVVFERDLPSDRDETWKIFNAEHFEYYILSGINMAADMAIYLGIIGFLIKRAKEFDGIIIGNSLNPTGMLAILYLRIKRYMVLSRGDRYWTMYCFFVPHKMWENKPVGSRYTIMESIGRQFKHVSEPLPAEGYINFGIVGLLLFGFLLGKVSKLLDEFFWNNAGNENNDTYTYLDIIYPFGMIFLFLIMRGDMLSSISYFIGYIAISLLLYKCCVKIRR